MITRILSYYVKLPKTAAVGTLATLIDMAVLGFLIHFLKVSPKTANIPSLFAGSLVQFFGNRAVLSPKDSNFKAHHQISGFFIAEVGAFALNGALFHFLVSQTSMTYVLVRPLATGIVFLGFSFPMWRLVFERKWTRIEAQAQTLD